MTEKHPNMGSSLDDFLKEEGIYEEVTEMAMHRLAKMINEKDLKDDNA